MIAGISWLDVRFFAGTAVAVVAYIALVILAAKAISTDAANPESMRQHQRRMNALYGAQERVVGPRLQPGADAIQRSGSIDRSAADR